MRNRLLIALLLATLLMLPCASYGKINGTFTLPDSVLLFETDSPGAPYDELLVVSTMGTVVVQAPSSFWGQLDTMALAPGADRIRCSTSRGRRTATSVQTALARRPSRRTEQRLHLHRGLGSLCTTVGLVVTILMCCRYSILQPA